MINDLELTSSGTSHWKHVDDVTISESLTINEHSVLQSDLHATERWTVKNNMKQNSKKCKEMVICLSCTANDIPRLHINEMPRDLVSSFEVRGITVNNKLEWKDNIELLVKKTSKRLYIIRVLLRRDLPPDDLLLVYFSIMHSVLEYACPVWHTILPNYLEEKGSEKSISHHISCNRLRRMPLRSRNASVLITDVKRFIKRFRNPIPDCLNHL